MKHHPIIIGAHMSITKGFDKAVEQAESIGCTALQIFTKSNRQWQAKPLTKDIIINFKQAVQNSTILPSHIVAHASYLINLGSPSKDVSTRSTTALIHELVRCHQLGIPYLVLHPGSHLVSSVSDCIDQMSTHLRTVLEYSPVETTVMLETMAGQGSSIGHKFEQIATILHNLSHYTKRIGVCFDSCHVFAAGYPLSTHDEYTNLWKLFDQQIGIDRLKVIHLNDSKNTCGSHVDRHEHIGKGFIGSEFFKLIMNDKRFLHIPKIVETPKKDISDHAKNIEILRNFVVR